VTIELKTEHLLDLGVDPAVLASPEEAHYPGHPVESLDLNKANGDAEHCEYDREVAQNGDFASEAVDDPADEEATEDLSKTEPDHGQV
jgi:hypothetical protein